MKLTLCPLCCVLHESVVPETLKGLNEEQVYQLTHCRCCELPVKFFYKGEVDAEDTPKNEIGYPAVVLPEVRLGLEDLKEWVGQVDARIQQ